MIKAKIVGILTKDDVSLFELKGLNLEANLFMLVLNEASKFALNDEISLGFKSSDVVLAKNRLDTSFEAIISNHALKALNLSKNDSVFAYIKSTSIHISTQK